MNSINIRQLECKAKTPKPASSLTNAKRLCNESFSFWSGKRLREIQKTRLRGSQKATSYWISRTTFFSSSSGAISSPPAILINEQSDGLSWVVSKRWTCRQVRPDLSANASCVRPSFVRSSLMTLDTALRIFSSGINWVSALGITLFYVGTRFDFMTDRSYYWCKWSPTSISILNIRQETSA